MAITAIRSWLLLYRAREAVSSEHENGDGGKRSEELHGGRLVRKYSLEDLIL
jgi:hypothetical protein